MSLTKFRTAFSPKFQDILSKSLIAYKVATTRLKPELTWGKTIQRNILDMGAINVRDVVRYQDRTINALGDDSEIITIDHQKSVDFKLDSWDKLQMSPLRLGENAGKRCALKLRQYIDADIFAETLNAYAPFDDGDIAGVAGNPVELTTSNFNLTVSNLQAKLLAHDVESNGNLVLIIDPYTASVITQTILGKNIALTDLTLKNGYAGPILSFKTYISNNLTFTAILSLPNQVAEGDTISIAGVTFTFNATPSGAGSVDIGADAAGTQANLIAAINGAAGEGSTYIALSDEDRTLLTTLRVEASSVASTIVIKAIGAGRIALTESITDSADVWSKKMIHCYAGKSKSIDLVVQSDVKSEPRKEPRQKTVNMLTDALYGLKTFKDGSQNFLDLQIAVL